MLKASACLLLGFFTACGGSSISTIEHAGAGGLAGTSNAGDSSHAGTSPGSAGAGAGDQMPDAAAGYAGQESLACAGPDSGPSAGPRVDGPMDLGGCADIPDEIVFARYRDFPNRVPQGAYYEPAESLTFWNEPCSNSVEETAARGDASTFLASYASEWFYDAIHCFNGSVRRTERNLRCDYFDGSTLANATPERLAFLGSMLWWSSHSNVDGDVLLGHSITRGDTTDVIELCSTSVTHGPSLCSELRLVSTKHVLRRNDTSEPGKPEFTVELGMPEIVRNYTPSGTSNCP